MPEPVLPEHLLADDQNFTELNGVTIRKGTAGAFFANLKVLSAMPIDAPGRAEIIEQLKQGLPTMRENGLFEMFEFRSPELAEVLGVSP
jgi:hypothetical protein